MAIKVVYQGDSFSDTFQLRTQNAQDTALINPFVIEAGSVVQVNFPGSVSSVILSTDDGTVSIVDANLSTIEYSGPASASFDLKIGTAQPVDVIVVGGITGTTTTFQSNKYITVAARANP